MIPMPKAFPTSDSDFQRLYMGSYYKEGETTSVESIENIPSISEDCGYDYDSKFDENFISVSTVYINQDDMSQLKIMPEEEYDARVKDGTIKVTPKIKSEPVEKPKEKRVKRQKLSNALHPNSSPSTKKQSGNHNLILAEFKKDDLTMKRVHNLLEKGRRAELRQRFYDLSWVINQKSEYFKQSKIKVLQEATDCINKLRTTVELNDIVLADLRKKKEQNELRLNALVKQSTRYTKEQLNKILDDSYYESLQNLEPPTYTQDPAAHKQVNLEKGDEKCYVKAHIMENYIKTNPDQSDYNLDEPDTSDSESMDRSPMPTKLTKSYLINNLKTIPAACGPLHTKAKNIPKPKSFEDLMARFQGKLNGNIDGPMKESQPLESPTSQGTMEDQQEATDSDDSEIDVEKIDSEEEELKEKQRKIDEVVNNIITTVKQEINSQKKRNRQKLGYRNQSRYTVNEDKGAVLKIEKQLAPPPAYSDSSPVTLPVAAKWKLGWASSTRSRPTILATPTKNTNLLTLPVTNSPTISHKPTLSTMNPMCQTLSTSALPGAIQVAKSALPTPLPTLANPAGTNTSQKPGALNTTPVPKPIFVKKVIKTVPLSYSKNLKPLNKVEAAKIIANNRTTTLDSSLAQQPKIIKIKSHSSYFPLSGKVVKVVQQGKRNRNLPCVLQLAYMNTEKIPTIRPRKSTPLKIVKHNAVNNVSNMQYQPIKGGTVINMNSSSTLSSTAMIPSSLATPAITVTPQGITPPNTSCETISS